MAIKALAQYLLNILLLPQILQKCSLTLNGNHLNVDIVMLLYHYDNMIV